MCDFRCSLLLLGGILTPGAEKESAPIRGADFPTVANRVVSFEKRVNARDPEVRKRVLVELTAFHQIPDRHYVAFLKRLVRDPDAVIRGRAIRQLRELWVTIPLKDLPQKFAGYHDRQMIDLEDRNTIPALLVSCRAGDAVAGYAAYVLGLLRHKAALPQLKALGGHGNIFVRFSAARALLECDDRVSARAILNGIIASQFNLYQANGVAGGAAPNADGRQPYYAAAACRALMECGDADKRIGLENLIALACHLERSTNVNDQSNVHHVRQLLAGIAGEYFVSEREARNWFDKKYGKLAPAQPDLP